MLIKGFTIERGQMHATHLLRTDQNEHVLLQEVRGFVSEDLHGAFKEAQAVARGTKCQKYLFSCVFAPPNSANLSDAQFIAAVDKTEVALGLGGQPRAVVFHEKDGRRHAHCVWSRIDAETMKAKHLSHWKTKLGEVSRELHREFGIEMPRGLKDKTERDKRNFTQAEWQIAKRTGEDPRDLKALVQNCWERSDGRPAFEKALGENSLFLARGDKRGLVVVDHNSNVHALPRLLGLKSKEVAVKLGDTATLRGVDDVRQHIGHHLKQDAKAKLASSRSMFAERQTKLAGYREQMVGMHRRERAMLADKQNADWSEATRTRQARLPRGLRGVWSWMTGKSAVIKQTNESEATRQAEKQAKEREELAVRQREERRLLQAKMEELRAAQAKELWSLRRELSPFLRERRESALQQAAQSAGMGLKLQR